MKTTDILDKSIVHNNTDSIKHANYKRILKTCFSSWAGKTVLILGALLLVFLIYLRTSRIVLNDGDNASILLQAYDLIHTSPILKEWYLPPDNFITLDMPLYMLGLLSGLKMPLLMKAIPSFLYTGVVFSGMYLASLGKMSKQKLLAILCFLAIVMFHSFTMAQQILQGPIHMGTILGTLLAFIAYYFYKENVHKLVALLILGLLTLLLVIGDPMSEIILVLPIIFVELIFLYKSKFTSRNHYFIVGMVLLSTLCALYVRNIWGQYVHMPANNLMFESVANIVQNGQYALQIVFSLFSGDFFQKDVFNPQTIPLLLNAFLVVLLAIGIYCWLKNRKFSFHTSQDALIAVLAFAIGGDIIAFVFTNVADSVVPRYLLPMFIFVGIIAFPILSSYIRVKEIFVVIILIFIVNNFLFVNMLYTTPTAIQPEKPVIEFLHQKHLSKGIGEYWSATGVTGQSNYTISVRQVLSTNYQLHPYLWLANSNWFSYDNIKDSQFIIYRKGDGDFYVASLHSFGKPNHVYTINDYIILAWNTPLFTHTVPGYHF